MPDESTDEVIGNIGNRLKVIWKLPGPPQVIQKQNNAQTFF